MNSNDSNALGSSIPIEPSHNTPKAASSVQPIGTGGEKGKLQPISIEQKEPGITGSSKIQTFESNSKLNSYNDIKFKRPAVKTGQGATRIRTFHAKLNDGAMHYLDNQINEWIDNNPDVEVKFCNTSIGVVEGKKAEQHLIISIWY